MQEQDRKKGVIQCETVNVKGESERQAERRRKQMLKLTFDMKRE